MCLPETCLLYGRWGSQGQLAPGTTSLVLDHAISCTGLDVHSYKVNGSKGKEGFGAGGILDEVTEVK